MSTSDNIEQAIAESARLPVTVASPVDAGARILFVLHAYPADPRQVPAAAGVCTRWTLAALDFLTLRRLRDYRGMYRDHYANVRSTGYMLGTIQAAIGALQPRPRPRLASLPAVATLPDNMIETVVLPAGADHDWRAMVAAGGHDAVVLVWPDALGLGAERLQRGLDGLAPLYALNGRRRLFRLDRAMQARIARRRFFAYTRVAELFFAIVAFPVAGVCAAIDRIGRRQHG